jgi:hypothetical protein
MSSAIDIASNALLLIGDNPISSFTEPGAGARSASNLYPATKEMVLSYHPWSFALKEQELSRLSQAPDSRTGYKYAYQIPTDLIRLWEIMPNSNYVMVGQLIYSNETALLARYVYDVAESLMPAQMVKAMEYKLASELAISVAEDENKAQLYEQKARDQMAKASNIDSQGQPQKAIVSSPFVEARFGGSYGGSYFR